MSGGPRSARRERRIASRTALFDRQYRWQRRWLRVLWLIGWSRDVYLKATRRGNFVLVVAGRVRTEVAHRWHLTWRDDPCVYCGAPAENVDHIQPRAAGGSDHWGNKAPTCFWCNQAKGTQNVLLFLAAPVRSAARRKSSMMRRIQRQIVRQYLRPSQQPAPVLTHPLGVKLMAALEARRRGEHGEGQTGIGAGRST